MKKASRFVSFEGIDFSGKTTQISLLAKRLVEKGFGVDILREPGGTPISERIREILLDKNHLEMTAISEMLLFSAARNQLVTQKVLPALRKGNFVIADRYVDSTTVYQGYGRKIDMQIINDVNRIATMGHMPSLTFFIDIDEDTFQERARNASADRLEQAGIDFFRRVRNGYLELAKKEKQRIVTIDGRQTIGAIQNEIWECVTKKLHLIDEV